ncbi:MAG: hypothetical protein A2V98_09380 [Planctomycetes bacterium RBG_16_64_12]|nr:MAG: hypothetical protein A2V98_09380 [Planctomycetes bacterium RBG_16_64_12]
MNNRRRKRYIDSAVQGALVRRIILHWLLFLAAALVVLPFWQVLSSGNLFSPFSRLMADGWAATAPVFVILIAMIPIFVWDTVTLSNRFVGPMYRFHKTIERLAAGEEVEPIRLRKGDFWKDVADDFNAVLERIARERQPDPSEPDPDAVPCGASDA